MVTDKWTRLPLKLALKSFSLKRFIFHLTKRPIHLVSAKILVDQFSVSHTRCNITKTVPSMTYGKATGRSRVFLISGEVNVALSFQSLNSEFNELQWIYSKQLSTIFLLTNHSRCECHVFTCTRMNVPRTSLNLRTATAQSYLNKPLRLLPVVMC